MLLPSRLRWYKPHLQSTVIRACLGQLSAIVCDMVVVDTRRKLLKERWLAWHYLRRRLGYLKECLQNHAKSWLLPKGHIVQMFHIHVLVEDPSMDMTTIWSQNHPLWVWWVHSWPDLNALALGCHALPTQMHDMIQKADSFIPDMGFILKIVQAASWPRNAWNP